MNPKIPKNSNPSTELLDQLAAAQAELEALSNSQLHSAISTVNHALLLKQAQDTLRENDLNLEDLIGAFPQPAFLQADGKIAFVNTAAIELLWAGTPGALVGKPILDIIHPDFHETVRTRLGNLCPGHITPAFDQRFVRLDGSVIDVQVAVAPCRYHSKPAVQVVVHSSTESKRSGHPLPRSELWFREIWNRSTDGMRLVALDGTTLMVNEAFCRMVQKPREEIEGKPFCDIYAEQRRPYILRRHCENVANGTLKAHFETDVLLWNNKKLWFEVANSFLEVEGQQKLILAIFRDITQRKRAEMRGTAFSKLGEQLNSTRTPHDAARIIVNVADELIGWDACSLDLYSQERNKIQALLTIDLLDGKKTDVSPAYDDNTPSAIAQKTMDEGPQLILRDSCYGNTSLKRFGNRDQASASLMFVPIRYGTQIIGILSIQSYAPNAYDEEDLKALRALADHCGGALHRLSTDTERARSEKQNAVLSKLARSLSAAETQEAAAIVIIAAADELLGWDACSLDVYLQEQDMSYALMVIDTVDGKRTTFQCPPSAPSAMARRVMQKGAELILRSKMDFDNESYPYGSRRPSASLLYVPLRHRERTIGVFSIQSYTPNAYKQSDLIAIQALADHCSGALDRIRNAEALRISEARFRTLSESMPVGIFETDASGQYQYLNSRWYALAGMARGLATGDGWVKSIHPDDKRTVLANWHKAISEGREWIAEYRLQTAVGTTRWVHAVASPIYSKDGKRIGYVGTVEDINERKRTERRNTAFGKLAQHLSATVSVGEAAQSIAQITDDLFTWESFTISLYDNATGRVTPVLSYDFINGSRTLVPVSATPELPSERAQRVIANGAELILREGPIQAKDSIRFGDLARPSLSIMVVPIRNRGAVVGLMSVQSYRIRAYDSADLITLQLLADHCGGALDRIRTEEALKNSELRFHSIWQNSVDGMRLTDENGTIVAVNDAYCKLVGIPREELEGQPFSIVYAYTEFPEEQLVKYKTRFQQHEIERTITRRLTFRNGKTVDLEDTNSFIEVAGRKPLLLALFRDQTEQKRLETELRQAQKMESVGQLAGGIAHDFNNILTVIQGHTSLLLIDQGLPTKVGESIRQISNVAERAANLTRQLLTFSRKQVMQPRSLDLNEVVSNVTKMLQRVLGEDVSLQVSFLSKLPLVFADQGMLEQVLMNLAINSRDAMPRGGKLFIETAAVIVNTNPAHPEATPGDYVRLSVRDTGCGIPPENLPRIFEPFFTTKDVGKGTGLGLATVYGAVKQHKGWVEVESEVNQGTTFKIFLPASAHALERPDLRQRQPKMRVGTETILLVEDETEVRSLARMILQRLGYKILEAESGVKALEIWEREKAKIDLLLSDIVMPDGMSGRDLAAKLQSEKSGLKVIFCSGYSREMVGESSILQEGVNFLQKPYTPQKLAQIVRECLDRRSN